MSQEVRAELLKAYQDSPHTTFDEYEEENHHRYDNVSDCQETEELEGEARVMNLGISCRVVAVAAG